MASGDPRDPVNGKPYTGTPVLQQPRGGRSTVLDMNRLVQRTITEAPNDDHYTSEGHLYHE